VNIGVVVNSRGFGHQKVPVDEDFVRASSQNTIQAVMGALRRTPDHHGTIEHESCPYLAGSLLAETPPDLVFNMAWGVLGSYSRAYVPQVLDSIGIPYTGSDPLTSALCQDKISCKDVIKKLRISTPRGFLISSMADLNEAVRGLAMPVFVKPNNYDGVGISEHNICRSGSDLILVAEELFEAGLGPLIVEDFIDGREISVSVIGTGPNAQVCPIVEVDFENAGGLEVFGAEMRQAIRNGQIQGNLRCPAKLHNRHSSPIEQAALRLHQSLGCREWSQIDFRIGIDQVPYVIEVNTIPDLEPLGDSPSRFLLAAEAAGIGFDHVVQMVLNMAVERAGIEPEIDPEQLGLGLVDETADQVDGNYE
jgi:D-alanine-D-alanine ligase